MGSFEDTKPKPAEETLRDAMEYLEETRFALASFVDCFKRYLLKAGILKEEDKDNKTKSQEGKQNG